jgi:hypothetical protein
MLSHTTQQLSLKVVKPTISNHCIYINLFNVLYQNNICFATKKLLTFQNYIKFVWIFLTDTKFLSRLLYRVISDSSCPVLVIVEDEEK